MRGPWFFVAGAFLALVTCESPLRQSLEDKVGNFQAAKPAMDWEWRAIDTHTPLSFRFDKAMDTNSLSLTGSLVEQGFLVSWTNTKSFVVSPPASGWAIGTGKTLRVKALDTQQWESQAMERTFGILGKVIFVSPEGSDLNPGTAEAPLASLKMAFTLRDALYGDTPVEFRLATGDFDPMTGPGPGMTIDRPTTITGGWTPDWSARDPVSHPTNLYSVAGNQSTVTVACPGTVTLDGIGVEGSGTVNCRAVWAQQGKLFLQGCSLRSNGGSEWATALGLSGTSQGTLSHCTASVTGPGVKLISLEGQSHLDVLGGSLTGSAKDGNGYLIFSKELASLSVVSGVGNLTSLLGDVTGILGPEGTLVDSFDLTLQGEGSAVGICLTGPATAAATTVRNCSVLVLNHQYPYSTPTCGIAMATLKGTALVEANTVRLPCSSTDETAAVYANGVAHLTLVNNLLMGGYGKRTVGVSLESSQADVRFNTIHGGTGLWGGALTEGDFGLSLGLFLQGSQCSLRGNLFLAVDQLNRGAAFRRAAIQKCDTTAEVTTLSNNAFSGNTYCLFYYGNGADPVYTYLQTPSGLTSAEQELGGSGNLLADDLALKVESGVDPLSPTTSTPEAVRQSAIPEGAAWVPTKDRYGKPRTHPYSLGAVELNE